MEKFSYIGSINSTAKIMKTAKVLKIDTYTVYLAPYKLSGHNVCSMATDGPGGCVSGCLNESGRSKMPKLKKIIERARIAKTKFFYSDRVAFNERLFRELRNAEKLTKSKKRKFAVRLNGTSDLSPILFNQDNKNVLESFPNVQFYDYTKVFNRMDLLKKYPNYHLTFSYSGNNWSDCLNALRAGHNVSVVFNLKKSDPLPETYQGYKVINGDVADYRPYDGSGVIVGLRFKEIASKAKSKAVKKANNFVVSLNK